MFEIFASTPENLNLADMGAFARRVEAMGYDGLFVSDAIHDGLLLACQALSATSKLKVGTSVLIADERGKFDMPALLRQFPDAQPVIAMITASELLHGVERAQAAERRSRRQQHVE